MKKILKGCFAPQRIETSYDKKSIHSRTKEYVEKLTEMGYFNIQFSIANMCFVGDREETDEEYERRISQEKWRLEADRRLYLKLKEQFENEDK